jgi:hypothetical protein
MAITFNGVTLKNPRIISETTSPSVTITIQCITASFADVSDIEGQQGTTFSKDLLVSGKVLLQGDGTKATLAFTGTATRNITNCMIVPPVQVIHNENYTIWKYIITFTQDTTT